MKRIITIALLFLITVGFCVSCNADAVEKVFDTSYKVQPDGSWKMKNKVYEPSTKPYILVLPKTVDLSKDVQLSDLQTGLKNLDKIRSSETAVKIGNAIVQLEYDDYGNEYYNYINKGDSSKAQNIFMRTKDDYTETILLNAPNDEFSHYGSLNVATVGATAQNSYYEYGRVKKVILSIGHLVVKSPSQIDMIIVNATASSEVSVDVETTNVKGIIAPEGVAITKPASVPAVKTEDVKFLDSDGKFYKTLAETKGNNVTLLANVEDLEITKSVEIDMFGNKITGNVTIAQNCTVTFTDSVGDGSLVNKPEGKGTFEVKDGNYGFDPTEYLKDKENTEAKEIEGKSGLYKVAKKVVNPTPTPGPNPVTASGSICFTAGEAGASVKLVKEGNPNSINLIYSTDGVDFYDYTIGTEVKTNKVGDKVYFAAKSSNSTFSKDTSNYYNFVLTKKMSCSGNIMYLLDANGITTTVPECAFAYLFSECANLTSVPVLPATELADSCYMYMFNGCTGLTSIPEKLLPATKLAKSCYCGMFAGCTGLTSIPEKLLPSTELADYCYCYMFQKCTGLTSIPEKLLPAEELKNDCYERMFNVCDGLTSIPEGLLPATGLANSCYYYMFGECKGLISIPEGLLPATTLAEKCYSFMFNKCTSLTTAPGLPATTLAKQCYEYMFQECTSLKSAPLLPAPTLVDKCYFNMFNKCSGLKSVTMLATNISATDCLKYWLLKVAPTGTLTVADETVKNTIDNSDLLKPQDAQGTSLIGQGGWTVQVYNPFYFEAVEAGATVELKKNGKANKMSLVYSTDGVTWSDYAVNTTITLKEIGDKVYFKAKDKNENGAGYADWQSYHQFVLGENKVSCKGNIMYLIDPTGQSEIVHEHAFYNLFANCKSLTTVPDLPATTLAYQCYAGMFSGCSSLTTVPENLLPTQETLASDCYSSMFSGCSSLTSAPKLPATTLANNCYSGMFQGCTSLETAPELPAETLVYQCYNYMFSGCTSLKSVTMLATKGLEATYCLSYWLKGVATTGTLIVANDTVKGKIEANTGNSAPINNSGSSLIGQDGWTVKVYEPFYFEAEEDGATVQLEKKGSPDNKIRFLYSIDGITYHEYNFDNTITLSKAGDKVYFKAKGKNGCLYSAYASYYHFVLGDKKVSCSGNIMYLLDSTGVQNTVPAHAFHFLFENCASLTTAPKLPAEILANSCYTCMFRGCTSLKTAPDLEAKNLAYDCYEAMFQNCTSLNSVTMLATNTSAEYCLHNWLNNVSTAGTLYVANDEMKTTLPQGVHGIPNGWTVSPKN